MRIDGNVYYVLKDRLGSAYATTDASGNVVGEMRYYAFGETRLSTGTMFTDRLYTGQRYIAELGIYHYNARFYSPKLGRFLSADTLMSGFANPQSLNRFSYVANNPVRYTDPTGHMMSVGDDGGGGSYTTSPIADYCSTHPSVCSGDDDDGGGGGTPTGTPTPTSTPVPTVTPLCTSPDNLCATVVAGQATYVAGQPTMLALQCQNYQCWGTLPNTPTATNTPYNVLATAGANIDIAANTAVVGAVNYCLDQPSYSPGCGQTAEQAYPPLAPWGTSLDLGIGTINVINDTESRPATPAEQVTSAVVGGATALEIIALLIFFFA